MFWLLIRLFLHNHATLKGTFSTVVGRGVGGYLVSIVSESLVMESQELRLWVVESGSFSVLHVLFSERGRKFGS